MRVLELWRFPVKSLQGERVEEVGVTASGLDGDRRFAIFDRATGFGLTARRAPELLFASARWRDGTVEITLPDGSTAPDDEALSSWLGRPVELRNVEAESRTYENPVDVEDEARSGWEPFNGASGPFHDSARARVTLVSTATIGAWDRRRFRANVLVEGEGEDALVGSTIGLGDAVVDVIKQIERCVMTTRPQPGGIERDLTVLRTIARERQAFLAVGGLVVRPGLLRVGDELIAAAPAATA